VGSYTYASNANYNGVDSFIYTVTDRNGNTDTATVSITVAPINDDFTDNNEAINVDEGSNSITGNVIDGSSVDGADGAVTLTIFTIASDATTINSISTL